MKANFFDVYFLKIFIALWLYNKYKNLSIIKYDFKKWIFKNYEIKDHLKIFKYHKMHGLEHWSFVTQLHPTPPPRIPAVHMLCVPLWQALHDQHMLVIHTHVTLDMAKPPSSPVHSTASFPRLTKRLKLLQCFALGRCVGLNHEINLTISDP